MKPTLRTGPASHYAAPNEVIREFGDGKGNGGLLSIRILDDGQMVVEIYQVTGPVTINTPTPPAATTDGVKRITVPVDVDLNMGDYELNYGTSDPAEAETYTGEIVRDAANERFKLLGWATIVNAPQA